MAHLIPKNAGLDASPRRRMTVLNVFAHNLKVKPVDGTRLIDISYTNPDPAYWLRRGRKQHAHYEGFV